MYKRYKYIHWGPWNSYSAPTAILSIGFSFIPLKISGKWIWLRKYYKLKSIKSAMNLGGHVNVQYKNNRALSIFEFKRILKEKDIIRNLYTQYTENRANWKKFKEHFNIE